MCFAYFLQGARRSQVMGAPPLEDGPQHDLVTPGAAPVQELHPEDGSAFTSEPAALCENSVSIVWPASTDSQGSGSLKSELVHTSDD
jgi:hypothetical protein